MQNKQKNSISMSKAQDGKISGAQQQFNEKVKERIEEIGDDLDRLMKLDTRINRDLIKKPYEYIDKVKDALVKEQKEIVSIVKGNNEKYMQKFAGIETKVDSMCAETKLLVNYYKKKIGEVSKNLESISKLRNEVLITISQVKDDVERIAETCNHNHVKLGDNIQKVANRFAEKTVDLTSVSEGFQREIERVQVLFREL